jgi:hypothetical protein
VPAKPAPPKAFATVAGDWSALEIGGPVTYPGGMAIVGDHVQMLVIGVDHGPVLEIAPPNPDSGWISQPVDGIGPASFAMYAPPSMLFVTTDSLLKTDILYKEGAVLDTLASGCDGVGDARLLAPSLATYVCNGERVIERAGTAIAHVPATPAAATLGDDGTVYVLSQVLTPPARLWAVHDGKTVASTVAGVDYGEDLAACGGQVYGLFDRHGAPVLGRLAGGAWQLEPIDAQYGGEGRLGFDEACHVFFASNNDVWSRGAHGWVKSTLPFADEVDQVIGHAGTLSVTYHVTHGDGVHAGYATAPLGYDKP